MEDKNILANENTNCFNIDLEKCTFLGQGRNGQVYLLPDGKVLKIFFREKNCKHEYEILQSVCGDKHFPKALMCKENCMIREYVGGTPITKYIETYGLDRDLVANIIDLIEDFKRLGFTRLDMRSEHIFVQEDKSLKTIDPRSTYTKIVLYPYSILSSLNRLGVLVTFLNILNEINPDLSKDWHGKYLYDKENDIHYWH